LITEAGLQAAAGDRAYARGVGYFRSGAVADLVVSGKTINARVVGTGEYAVRFRADGGDLEYACTCPVGDAGVFCKHAVAAGLAWLAREQETPGSGRETDDLSRIRAWITAAPRAWLEELLIEQALGDPGFRGRLDAQAVRSPGPKGPDLKALEETVGTALAVRGFVDYGGMRRLLERARTAADLIAGLIEEGHAATARELAHHALMRGIATYTRTDDSGGGFGDLLRDIAALHLETCRVAPPDPAAFGKQLFDLLLLDEWSLLAFEDYAQFLGTEGLRVFRALAEKKWQKVAALGPGESRMACDSSRQQVTAIMEALAREVRDTDALVAIKSRNLSCPYRFLDIAQTLAEAGRRYEALDWAERGHRTFPGQPDSRLVEFLACEYARRGRYQKAVALVWEQFTHAPSLASYRQIHKAATPARVWDVWRSKALAWLRERAQAAPQRGSRRLAWGPGGQSLLIEILLWEGDSDAALAAARAGGCSTGQWLEIAKARENTHPADAAEIYRARLDDIVGQKSHRGYDEAAALVKKIRNLMQRTNDERGFAAWLDAVRVKHKAKRNFMQRLEKVVGGAGEADRGEATA
jgi:uncharacterized Zn finger protein